MITIPLYFKHNEEIRRHQEQYSLVFRKCYANKELLYDKEFQKSILDEFDFYNSLIFQNTVVDVMKKYNSHEAQRNKKLENIEFYTNELQKLKPTTENNRRNIFKYRKKISKTRKNIDSDIVFGSKKHLSKYVYNLNMYNSTGLDEYKERADKHLLEFKNKRIMEMLFVGQANQRGNQKFIFDFNNQLIIYKPKFGTKIKIELNLNKSQRKIFAKLQVLISQKKIAITVMLSSNCIKIVFDNEKLNGYNFLNEECKNKQNQLPKSDKDGRKKLYIEFKREQDRRKLIDKNIDVYAGIDLNPNYIAVCIRNKDKILYTTCYNLKNIKRLNKNRKKHNIALIYKDIFKTCKHFKVSSFVMEKLDFKPKLCFSKSRNNLVKSFWSLTFQKNLIKKYCENFGIILLEINPSYSSFVGNLLYENFDPINAAMELSRRGMVLCKILNERWYPEIECFRLNNKSYVSDLENIKSIPELYTFFISRKLRYRRSGVPEFKFKFMDSLKLSI